MNKPAARVVELVGRGWDQVKSPLYRNAIFIMLTSVISSGLGFFFWLIVANKYAKEDLGAAVTLFQTLGFIGALGNLGIGIGLIRYMGETEDKGKMINAGLTLSGVVTLALCSLFLVLPPSSSRTSPSSSTIGCTSPRSSSPPAPSRSPRSSTAPRA